MCRSRYLTTTVAVLALAACAEVETAPLPVPPLAGISSGAVLSNTPGVTGQQARPVDPDIGAPLAAIDPSTGELVYGFYANEAETEAVNLIPDFSHAGYGGGGVALPTYASIPVQETLSPGSGDRRGDIQAALDRVAALPADGRGIRGAVLLSAGSYQVDGQLSIPASGVVLRGEGQGEDGTILRAITTETNAVFIVAVGQGGGENPREATDARRVDITQDYLPTGATQVTVASTQGYSVGDQIAIHRDPTDEFIGPDFLDMAQWNWSASQYDVSFQRTVTAIDGDTLHFDIPTVESMQARFGDGEVYRIDVSARLQQIGIENLRLETLTSSDVTNRDRAIDAIFLREVQHSWIRDVTVRYFSYGFEFSDGVHFVTAQNVAHLEPNFEVRGGNHYAFDMEGGGMNLFQRCYADSSRHAFTTGSRTTGPNVFLDCLAEQGQNDSGPHQRWAVGTLFDNTSDELIRVQNREDAGSGHGWAGMQQMIWGGFYDEMVLQAAPYSMSWAVGNVAEVILGSRDPDAPLGIYESHGQQVLPRSLYLQQLEDRLGPEAVAAVTYGAQRTGRIWTELAAWQGQGTFLDAANEIIGTAGDDVLTGTADADTLIGLGGADSISGGDGNDLIIGDTCQPVPELGLTCE